LQGEGVLPGPARLGARPAGAVQLRLPGAVGARPGEPPVGDRLRTSALRAALLAAVLVGAVVSAPAEDALPPPPEHYFNDYAGVVPKDVAERLDAKLRDFDEQSSSQIVVTVFPELPSPSLEDFTIRAAQSWRVGRKKLDNGVVLFVFIKDRKMRIEVGYGLEGALPDATANGIIRDVMAP